MGRASLRTLFGLHTFNLLTGAFFLGSFIRGWRTDDWTWLGFNLLFGMRALLEIVWPEPSTRAKPITISMAAMTLVGIALFAGGGWRGGWQRGMDKSPAFPIPTTLSVTPAKAFQGQTLDVNIGATGAILTDRSIANFGPGITTSTNRMIDATTLLARIQIVKGAVLGGRRVWVATPGAQIAIDNSPAGAFQVLAAAPVVNE